MYCGSSVVAMMVNECTDATATVGVPVNVASAMVLGRRRPLALAYCHSFPLAAITCALQDRWISFRLRALLGHACMLLHRSKTVMATISLLGLGDP